MATTNFENANLRLLITDTRGIVTTASLQQTIGSSVSGGSLLTATVILTDAQIKTLPTTPVVMVPATETLNYSGFPSKLFFPIKVYGVLDTRQGVYGNVTDGVPILSWGSDSSWFIGRGCAAGWGNSPISLDAGNVGSNLFGSPGLTAFGMLIMEGVLGAGDLFDNSIALSILNSGALTGGNSSNTLKIIVQYLEVSVP